MQSHSYLSFCKVHRSVNRIHKGSELIAYLTVDKLVSSHQLKHSTELQLIKVIFKLFLTCVKAYIVNPV